MSQAYSFDGFVQVTKRSDGGAFVFRASHLVGWSEIKKAGEDSILLFLSSGGHVEIRESAEELALRLREKMTEHVFS